MSAYESLITEQLYELLMTDLLTEQPECARARVNRWVTCPECESEAATVGVMGHIIIMRCPDCGHQENNQSE